MFEHNCMTHDIVLESEDYENFVNKAISLT
jgi:hypothetical protein